MLSIKQLEIVFYLQKIGTVSGVADELGIKQPTVSFHMQKIEKFAGIPLFESRKRRVFLTNEGKVLYQYAAEILALIHEAEQSFIDYRKFKKGKVLIGASNTAANYYLPAHVKNLKAHFPLVDLAIEVQNARMIVDKLKNYQVDLGIVIKNQINDPDIMSIMLAQETVGMVMSPKNRLAGHGISDPSLLQNETIILRESHASSRIFFEEWIKKYKSHTKVSVEIGSTEAIKQAVRMNTGISFLSKLAVKDEIEEGTLIFKEIINYSPKRGVYLIYHKHRHMTPLLEQFIHHFVENAARKVEQ
ncbi:LysR family transcriptional regulator [Sporolactobacillus shoreicorticis]|uniref:LysR substrate-binding domain-containing protein n=1 Tax=Sporolactobacillus shoreicorticis TaxID=1923877 RepID=A0ABW5RY64_9BACL|nr:LysR family transcriptional regulator [Sporolactobacillus shoreicorticis]MCO7125063.1 LysR family transcriptional regulator [Sporolactobacillus shoreicorticis]